MFKLPDYLKAITKYFETDASVKKSGADLIATTGRPPNQVSFVIQTKGVPTRPDDFLLMKEQVRALQNFLSSEDGKNLLAGYRRAANIVRQEEKKDKRRYVGSPSPNLFILSEEFELANALKSAAVETRQAIKGKNFEGAMFLMAKLRPAVDAFFEKVTVNAEDPKLRENRLKLLNEIRQATRAVADFSRIEG